MNAQSSRRVFGLRRHSAGVLRPTESDANGASTRVVDSAGDAQGVLCARNLSRQYGDVRALDAVNIDIGQGELLGLLGHNGAGKTTLLSIVAGLVRPDGGSVHVCGLDAQANPLATRRMIGIAPQELAVYLALTARENLRFFGRMAGLRGSELRQRIDDVVDALELTEFVDRKAQVLSGGEVRRLHTAIAIMRRPSLLLLDEPTVGVDVETRNRILDLVKSLAESGAAICYTTHYLREVETLATSVMILDHGRVIAQGRTEDLVAQAGGVVVEVRVEGAIPPELSALGTVDSDEPLVRIRAPAPDVAIRNVLAVVQQAGKTLTGIEVVHPSIENVYLQLTGRRFDVDGASGADK